MEELLQLKFAKTRHVKEPAKGTDGSAGIDFFVPYFQPSDFKPDDDLVMNKNLDWEIQSITVDPGERIKIPSGIKVDIPKGYCLLAVNKSGVFTKTGLDIGAALVDEDYMGEIHLSFVNTAAHGMAIIPFGSKLSQFILLPVPKVELVEISTAEEMYKEKSSARGEGGFGSTGAT
ncbi:MAG TPA: hypothetical protein PLA71_00195 [Saccharofermentans sp.]|nr:hypothetical protein [Saccharofermentans sp.]